MLRNYIPRSRLQPVTLASGIQISQLPASPEGMVLCITQCFRASPQESAPIPLYDRWLDTTLLIAAFISFTIPNFLVSVQLPK